MGLGGGMPLSPTPAAAAAAALAAAGKPEPLEYRLGVKDVRVKWEEVAVAADGALQHLPRLLSSPPPPADQQQPQQQQQQQLSSGDGGSMDVGGVFDALAEAEAAAEAEAEEYLRGEPRHGLAGGRLTVQQRASMVPRTFNLRAGDHPLVRVTLQPPMDAPLQPGAALGVFLDLRAAHGPGADPSVQPTCLQVAVLLQSEEEVNAPYAHRGPKPGSGAEPGPVCAGRTLYAEQSQVTAHLLTGQFTFSIPPNAHPSFRTPLVSHRWALRFELTLGGAPRGAGARAGKRGTEQLVWSLPLVVCPPCT
ncbi:MAG: hypothetical protein J3K34DRAFT_517367 [Monoraphidium minutum]|nr:MAG: hypothetical protein J3K34DRAFT_517367 [Monoraphidium minutum]